MPKSAAAVAEPVWKGIDSLRPHLIAITDLKAHPRNPRRHDLQAIAASLNRFGQQRPILCLPDGTIVAGHGTTNAAGAHLGWTHVAALVSELSDAEIEGYLLADNRTSDLGYYEQDVLASVLNDALERGLLDGTGYTPDDVDDLNSELGRIAESERQATDAAHSETAEEIEARQALRQAGAVMREVVLMLSDEQYEKFALSVRMLKREYALDGVIETVYEAVTRAAAAL